MLFPYDKWYILGHSVNKYNMSIFLKRDFVIRSSIYSSASHHYQHEYQNVWRRKCGVPFDEVQFTHRPIRVRRPFFKLDWCQTWRMNHYNWSAPVALMVQEDVPSVAEAGRPRTKRKRKRQLLSWSAEGERGERARGGRSLCRLITSSGGL